MDLKTLGDILHINKELNALEMKEKKVILASKPLSLLAILTRRCNLICIMCGVVKREHLTLPFECVKKIYSLFPYLEQVKWEGGEVFLVDYFKELFGEAAKYSYLEQHITTNGLLIDKEWAEIFAQSNVTLVYSIDAVTKSTYEYIRRGAKFEDLIKSIEIVNEANRKYNGNIRLNISVVTMKCNYKELSLFPDFCKKYNVKLLNLEIQTDNYVSELDIFIKRDDNAIKYLSRSIPEIEYRCNEYKVDFRYHFRALLNDFADGDGCAQREDGLKCTLPWTNMHIEPDGQVYPESLCVGGSIPAGNLKHSALEEIWNSEVMQIYRTAIRENEPEKICRKACQSFKKIGRTYGLSV